ASTAPAEVAATGPRTKRKRIYVLPLVDRSVHPHIGATDLGRDHKESRLERASLPPPGSARRRSQPAPADRVPAWHRARMPASR
ncbi:hypothetical protein C1T28_21405, partial [Bacillus subtilis]